jgi:hypothetical protein
MAIANTTYAALTMRDGDRFSKKFGGPTGLDPDYYRVRIIGYTGENATGSSTSFIDHYLADFRFPESQLDFIQADWRTIDLSGLGRIRSIGLEIDSSDRGQFGINTPVYFAMDRLSFQISPIAWWRLQGFSGDASVVTLRKKWVLLAASRFMRTVR